MGDSGAVAPGRSGTVRVLAVIRHPVGGIRTYLRYVYRYLPPERFRFTVIVVPGNEPLDLRELLPSHASRLVESRGRQEELAFFRTILAELRSGNHDLIHSHGYTAGAVAALANSYHRLPHILTSHGMLAAEQWSPIRGSLKRAALGRLFSGVTVLHSVSHDAEADLVRHLPRLSGHSGLTVIPTGVDLGPLSPPSADDTARWREARDVPPDAALLGFLGRIMPEKGFEVLIDAVQHLAADSLRFVVAVAGDGAFIRERRAEIEQRGLTSYFRFLGFQPNPVEMLARLDGVVMPSISEALGLVAIEALIVGRPLIASTCPGLREVVAGTPALTVPPGDSRALSDAIRRLIGGSTQFEAQARAYAPVAVTRFDARQTADRVERLMTSVLSPPV